MQQTLVTIAEFSTSWEGQIAKNFLEERGVRAFIADAHLEGMSLMVSIKLQVAVGEAEMARSLLAAPSETQP